MNELQEELDAISFADVDELSLTMSVGWRTFLKCLGSLWPLALICAIPPACIIANIPFDAIFERMGVDGLKAIRIQTNIENMVEAPFSTIMTITAMVTAVRAIAGRRLGLLANLKTAFLRLPAFIVTTLLLVGLIFAVIFVMVGVALTGFLPLVGLVFAAAIVLAVMYGVSICFCMHSTIIGGHCGTGALGESVRLVKGRWWITLGELIVISLVSMLLSMPVFASGMIEGLFADCGMAVRIASGVVTTTLTFLAGLFFSSAITVMYLLRRWRLREECSSGSGVQGLADGDEGFAQESANDTQESANE